MHDSDEQYSARREPRRRSSQQPGEAEDYAYSSEEDGTLPAHSTTVALVAGGVGGIVALLVPVLIILINSGLFEQASRLSEKMPYATAVAITEWQCGGVFVDLVIAFLTGFVVGRIAVIRRLGFFAGLVVGGVAYLGNVFVHYIPNYPDRISATATTPNTGGIVQGLLGIVVLTVIWALVGGLMSAWGARTATGRHPYYQKPVEAE